MYEAFVLLCLQGDVCRTALLPGYAAAGEEACLARLAETPPEPGAGATAFAEPPYCAERPASALAFAEIAPGVFAHRGEIAEPSAGNLGDVANIAFVIGGEAVAVIDAGGSRWTGEQVYLAVRARTELPIRAVILTHMHPDHVFGAAPLAEAGAELVGREGLARALADRAESYETAFARLIGPVGFLGTRVPVPEREIAAAEAIDLGGRRLDLLPQPTAHTATDLVVLDPQAGVLFAGDLVFAEHAPALDGSLLGWRAALDRLGGETVALVVPGHGGPVLPWPAGSADLARYLGVLEGDTRAAIEAGVPLSEAAGGIARSEAGNWELFDLFTARNATVAYTELEWE